MPNIECGLTTCVHNGKEDVKYGFCKKEPLVTLKWKAAIDYPVQGTIVYMECLNFDMQQVR